MAIFALRGARYDAHAAQSLPLPIFPSRVPSLPVSLNMNVPFVPEYNKTQDFIWDTYLKASKDEDEARPKNWEGSTTGILTFVRRATCDTALMLLTRTVDWSLCRDCCGFYH